MLRRSTFGRKPPSLLKHAQLRMRVSLFTTFAVLWLAIQCDLFGSTVESDVIRWNSAEHHDGGCAVAAAGGPLSPDVSTHSPQQVSHEDCNKAFWSQFWARYNFVGEDLRLTPDSVLQKCWRHLCPQSPAQSLGISGLTLGSGRRADSILVPLSGTGDDLEFIAEMCRPSLVLGVELEQLPIAVFYRRLLGTASRGPLSAGMDLSIELGAQAGSAVTRFFERMPNASFPAAVAVQSLLGIDTYSVSVQLENRASKGDHSSSALLAVAAGDFLTSDVAGIGRALLNAQPGPSERKGKPVAADGEGIPNAASTSASAPLFDAAFDRRAFCAIPPALRQVYVAQLEHGMLAGGRLLIVLLHPKEAAASAAAAASASPAPRDSPPWAVSQDEMLSLFSASSWLIEALGRPIASRHGPEQAYLMVRK